jgi:hypothetical protein
VFWAISALLWCFPMIVVRFTMIDHGGVIQCKNNPSPRKGIESPVTSRSENPTLRITTLKLDGLIYLTWS